MACRELGLDPVDDRPDAGADRIDAPAGRTRPPRRRKQRLRVRVGKRRRVDGDADRPDGRIGQPSQPHRRARSPRRSSAAVSRRRASSCASARGRRRRHPAARRAGGPSVTPAKEGWNSEPWPSTICQWSSAAAGVSHSAAPEMKSATTASIATPRPAIRTPVWPVAQNSASKPRSRHLPLERQRRVFLADRAVGADRQQPHARPLRALAGGEGAVGVADVVQLRAVLLRGARGSPARAEPLVQAARDVHAGLDRLDDASRSSAPAARRRH